MNLLVLFSTLHQFYKSNKNDKKLMSQHGDIFEEILAFYRSDRVKMCLETRNI